MKEKKHRQKVKVIPHCYRRNLSRTLSNSSVSQLVVLGSYKKRINDLLKNNRHLAATLQEFRVEAAVQQNMLKDCVTNCNKILFARLKLNEMAKNVAKFVTDLEEVRSYLDFDLLSDKFPFTNKKGSPSDKLCKEPDVNRIDEVIEDSSVNEVAVSENIPAVFPVPTPIQESLDKMSNIISSASRQDDENMEIAPILFTDDSEEKKKKSSTKRKTSKMSCGPDNESFTPELNIDLTSVKLKRNSSRRQTQFMFPDVQSTSRGKTTSAGKEIFFEELITPVKPTSPAFIHEEQDSSEIKRAPEHILKNPIINIKEIENPSSLPENNQIPLIVGSQCDHSSASTINPERHFNVTLPKVQPGESNHTVLLCEDMELTEVIRPVHPIIVQSASVAKPSHNPDFECNIIKEAKENAELDFSDDINTKEIASKHDDMKRIASKNIEMKKIASKDTEIKIITSKDTEMENITSKDTEMKNITSKDIENITNKDNEMKKIKSKGNEIKNITNKDNEKKKIKNKDNEKRKVTNNEKKIAYKDNEKKKVRNTSNEKLKITSKANEKKEIESKENDVKKITNKDNEKERVSSQDTNKKKPTSKSDINKLINNEEDSEELFNIHQNIPKLLNNEIKLSEINENDEVQNVGLITFCEPNGNDVKLTSKASKSAIRSSRQVKPVQYAIFFSSDESDAESSFEILAKKSKSSKHKTVISSKADNSKKSQVSQAALGNESEIIKNNHLKFSEDNVYSEKNVKLEKKSSKKSKDVKINIEEDLTKLSSQKYSAVSKDKNSKLMNKENAKKLVHVHENAARPMINPKNVKNFIAFSPPSVIDISSENEFPEQSSQKSLAVSEDENVKFFNNNNNNNNLFSPFSNIKINSKDEVPKQSFKKSTTSSKDGNLSNNENAKKLMPDHENVKNIILNPVSTPRSSPDGILKKSPANFHTVKGIQKETPLSKDVLNDNLDDSITDILENPVSESRKVSFAATDLVYNFRRMSVSKKIAENKKMKRISKSIVDFEELQQETQTKASHTDAGNSSESTNTQKLDNPPVPNFSGDTELYTFHLPTDIGNFSSVPTPDDLLKSKFNDSPDSPLKIIHKKSKHLKKVPSSKPVKSTGKISLKKNKDSKAANSHVSSGEILKERVDFFCQSPVSVCKPAKRKSLFKEHLDDDSKENINLECESPEKPRGVLREKDKTNSDVLSLNTALKKKSQSKTQGKVSMKKKLSDKPKLLEPTPEPKKKKTSVAVKSHEDSFVLKDKGNLPEMQDEVSAKRRSRQITSYKEPSLNKKMRRE